MKTIGITTTVPIEVLIAAGYQAIDLNNILVSDPDPARLVGIAERNGFPLNCCAWIKGIYGVCIDRCIREVICVTGGDCSNNIMLMEVLRTEGINAVHFEYPPRPDLPAMQRALQAMAERFETDLQQAETVRERLQPCRELARQFDELTWKENRVSGWENHLWLVSASDFNGDIEKYRRELSGLIQECRQRQPYPRDEIRLAYVGVPAVYARELYSFLESNGARVVFNEVQRQFAMPCPAGSLAEQYTAYTYPYSIQARLKDITTEMERRRIDGVIHYVQAFCHRGIGDIIFRRTIPAPLLTLEGNDDFSLSTHVKTRIEAFLDMIIRKRQKKYRQAIKSC